MTRKPKKKKRPGLNTVNRSIVKIQLVLVTDLNFYACFLCFCSFFASGYVGAFSSEQGIEPLGNKMLKALPC